MKKVLAIAFILSHSIFLNNLNAEGTAQLGPGHDLMELERNYIDSNPVYTGPPTIFVDILETGETINISAGNNEGSESIYIDLWDPDADPDTEPATNTYIISSGDSAFLSAANQPIVGQINNPIRHEAGKTGKWAVRFKNGNAAPCSSVSNLCAIDPFDITVTPPGYFGPVFPYSPPDGYGRISSKNWTINSTNYSDIYTLVLYVLTDSGFDNSEYLWIIKVEKFNGFISNIIANTSGIKPQTGYSLDRGSIPVSTVEKKYPIYLNPPEIAKPAGIKKPEITGFYFLDNADVDQTISTHGTPGVQDTGRFYFTTNLETAGKYTIIIDLDKNGLYEPYAGSSDLHLHGDAVPGHNSVSWDGTDRNGVLVPAGPYNAKLFLRVGEMHLPLYDVEFTTDGIRIFDMNETDGTTKPSPSTIPQGADMYWCNSLLDETKLVNNNIPTIVSSFENPANSGNWSDFVNPGINSHAWGVGIESTEEQNSSGDDAVIDTYVFKKSNIITKIGAVIITTNDSTDLDTDAILNLDDPDPLSEDSDNDGINDHEEIHGPDGVEESGDETDPLDVDTDDDGITDYDERNGTLLYSTDPLNRDTDEDGISDGVELGIVSGCSNGFSSGIGMPFSGTDGFIGDSDSGSTTTNPLSIDTDGDSISDGDEDSNKNGKVDSGETDPNFCDTDRDNVENSIDNCVNDANPDQNDRDNDGQGDLCDPCPDDQFDDADGDGLCGDVDNCQNVANTGQEDIDSDGLGDLCDPCPDYAENDSNGDGTCDNLEYNESENTVNYPPSKPELISPGNESVVPAAAVDFQWKNSIDPENDKISYTLYISVNSDFSDSDTQIITYKKQRDLVIYSFMSPFLLIFPFSMLFRTGSVKVKRNNIIGTLLLLCILFSISCSGNDSDNAPGTSLDTMTHQVSNLKSGSDYYWKVAASDSKGNETESDVWYFTIE